MKWRKVFYATIGLFLATAAAAWAQGHIKLTSVAEVEKQVLNQEGQKVMQRVAADKVTPGTEVIFTTFYENISNDAAQNAVITNPVPQHMIYTQGSAQGYGATVTYSVDGGKTYDSPAKLFVVDGSGRRFAARPQDYTHIRWTFNSPLPSGAKGDVSFRAVLQ